MKQRTRLSIDKLVLGGVVPGILSSELAGGAGVELVQDALGDTVEQLLGVDAEEVPGDVERLVDGAGLVRGLADEGALEFLEELEGELVFGGKGFLTDDGLHGGCFDWLVLNACDSLGHGVRHTGVTTDGVLGVQLVGHIGVVLTGAALTDSGLHQTGQRRQHVNGWPDTLVVKLTINEDLTLGNVTSQIGNGVSDI